MRIQETHELLLHCICDLIDQYDDNVEKGLSQTKETLILDYCTMSDLFYHFIEKDFLQPENIDVLHWEEKKVICQHCISEEDYVYCTCILDIDVTCAIDIFGLYLPLQFTLNYGVSNDRLKEMSDYFLPCMGYKIPPILPKSFDIDLKYQLIFNKYNFSI